MTFIVIFATFKISPLMFKTLYLKYCRLIPMKIVIHFEKKILFQTTANFQKKFKKPVVGCIENVTGSVGNFVKYTYQNNVIMFRMHVLTIVYLDNYMEHKMFLYLFSPFQNAKCSFTYFSPFQSISQRRLCLQGFDVYRYPHFRQLPDFALDVGVAFDTLT